MRIYSINKQPIIITNNSITMEEQAIKKKRSPIRTIILVAVLLAGGYFGYKKIDFMMSHETTDNAQVKRRSPRYYQGLPGM